MNKELQILCDELSADIQRAYEEQVSITEAEKLAAKFLGAQIKVANALQIIDLDARMRKSGLKAVKAQVYLENATKGDKKPSDILLNALVDTASEVLEAQGPLDEAETQVNLLKNYYDTFLNSHIFFRGIAKGSLNG